MGSKRKEEIFHKTMCLKSWDSYTNMQHTTVQDSYNSTANSLQGNDIVMIAIGRQQKVESSSYSK